MHPLPLAAGVALAGYLVVRRERLSRALLATGTLATALLITLGVGALPMPDAEELIADAGRALGKWTYLLVAALAFLETGAFVGLVAPGETTVIVGGMIAGQGVIDPVVLTGVTWACAVAGDVTSYALGRRLGRGFLVRHGPRLRITPERLRDVERFFERRGGATILIGRFIGLVRALAPFLAGASKMPLRTFLPYDVIGAGLWSGLFVGLGYVFWQSFDRVTEYVGRGAFALGTLAAVVLGALYLRRAMHDPQLRRRVRTRLERHRLAGPARFAYRRLTPGELGLELTTLSAVAFAGGFAFLALGLQVDAAAQLPGDRMAFNAFDAVRAGWLDDTIRVVTDVGSFGTIAPLTLVTAGWVAYRDRVAEALALVSGLVLAVTLVNVGKDEFDRARPLEPLDVVPGLAYPSGHTAYATALVACAVVLVRAGSSLAVRLSAVGLGLAGLGVVAASRVYLRVHYLSDVVGGAALGLACFALCGLVALVVAHIRHNGRPQT